MLSVVPGTTNLCMMLNMSNAMIATSLGGMDGGVDEWRGGWRKGVNG